LAENPVVTAFKECGLYKREVEPGKHEVTCPWLGAADVVTLAAAKRKYQQLKAQVTIGEDPLAEKKRKRAVPLYRELVRGHSTCV
jgi:hypothetical protein